MDNIDISFGDDVLLGHGNGVTIDDYNDNVISSETLVGPQGPPGPAGFSPIANVTQTEDGAIIRITDESGTTTANVANGTDGVSPTATVTGTASGATITITDANGTTTATVNNGEDGEPGDNATISIGQVSTLASGSQATVANVGTATNAVLDFGIPEGQQGIQGPQGDPGINARAYVTQNTGSATITIEDSEGTTTATVYDGADGTDGVTPVITATASVDSTTGTPSVSVTKSGTDVAPQFSFAFSNLKGETGPAGDPGLMLKGSITKSTNLNDYGTIFNAGHPDGYYGYNDFVGSGGTGHPADSSNGHMLIISSAYSSTCNQIIFGGSNIYLRRYANGSWGRWTKFAGTAN